MQEVHLDKNVKLLDCPGVVMLKSSDDDASIALQNCKRIEKLEDPVGPVKKILDLCPAERLMSLYKLPSFSSVDDFLCKVATLRGKLKKGGIVDVEAAARIVLHDWNEGKIPHYTLPLVRNQVDNVEAVVVSEFGKEFNVDDVYKTESSFIGTLPSVEEFNHVEVPPSSPPPNFDEQMDEGAVEQNGVTQNDESMTRDSKDPEEAKQNTSNGQNNKLYTAEGILDPRKRRAEKKRRKAQKLNSANDMDADYDFKVDYRKQIDEADNEDGDEEDESNNAIPMAGVELE